MRKMKYVIGILLLFMVIGFATVSVSLSISGNAKILSDADDFKVYFSDVYVNGKRNWTIVETETSIIFDVKLVDVGSEQVVSYDVTNASRVFDATLSLSCTQGDDGLSVVNEFDTSNLAALSTRTGVLTIRKVKSNASETDTKYEIACNIIASPVSRSEEASGDVAAPIQSSPTILLASSYSDTSAFRSDTYKKKIKNVTFEKVPEGDDMSYVESWDIGVAQNGDVMAYLAYNSEDENYYDLYIRSDSKIYANEDMSYWFYGLSYVDSINGLEMLDTSNTTNMECMFYNTGYNSSSFSLDVSDFDTSKVTNMYMMFANTGYKSTVFSLDISGFDTGEVTDMYGMFNGAGYTNESFVLDVSHFDTRNVIDMYGMFANAGYNSTTLELDVSGFDTSKVTNMGRMFYYTGYKSKVLNLNVSGFDTSEVTNMSEMFCGAGVKSTVLSLDVSNFDTSKVTTMNKMFYQTGYNNVYFDLDVSHFDMSNVTVTSSMFYQTGYNSWDLNISILINNPNTTSYGSMFHGVATMEDSRITVNYTNETSELVDKMIATKSSASNVVKGYNQDSIISFKINGVSYNAYEGMRWGQFVDSEFNTINLIIDPSSYSLPDECMILMNDEVIYDDDLVSAKVSSVIVANKEYGDINYID